MDVEALLEPRGDDSPSGDNLEYDPTFMDLEIAGMPGEERQIGDQTIPAEDPDFKEVSRLAQEILDRSHDLRAAVYLANAQLRIGGLPAFADVLTYMAGCLDRHWATCHPELDEDDGDPTMRVNAVLGLADTQGVLRSLRLAPLTESRTFGRMSLRDIMIADGEITAPAGMDSIPDAATVGAAFKDTNPDTLSAMQAAAQQAADMVRAISAAFDENVPGQGPNLDPLQTMIDKIAARLTAEVGGDEAPEEDDAEIDYEEADEGHDAGAAPAPTAAPAAGGAAVGAIRNTKDVINAIDRIIEYYKRTEPSSPVPIILHRARKLVDADFMAILADMLPESVDEIQRLGGLEVEDAYEE